MGKFVKGDVVVLPFPFSDLTSYKKRPALILADITGDDYIMIQITSKGIRDNYAISLVNDDFSFGTLNQESNLRPNKVFTLDQKLILYKIGHLTDAKLTECVNKICNIIQS